MMRYCIIRVAKTKALISFAVTAKLICVFVFAYTKLRFSHNAAHILMSYTFNAFRFSSANEVNVLQDRKTIRKYFFFILNENI